jgi:hypothetical protein
MYYIKQTLDPLIQLLPPGIREYWLLIFLFVAVLALLPVARYQRQLRTLVVRQFAPRVPRPQPKLEEDLEALPALQTAPGQRRLLVEGVPVRLRLVVLAPLGKLESVSESAVEEILTQVLFGLGSIYRLDKPLVRIWPAQLSHHGFSVLFHRNMRKQEPDDQPSRWVLLAGTTPPRPRPVLLGLSLWADAPTMIGKRQLDPGQWTTALTIQTLEPVQDNGLSAEQPAAAAPEVAPPMETPQPVPPGGSPS